MKNRSLSLIVLALSLYGATGGVRAQMLPDRPVRMIVPFAAGSGTDIAARLLTTSLSGAIKHPIVIENRPGALAVIGTDQAAKAPPDGLTLVATGSTAIAAAPSLFRKLPYDPVNDLAPVSLLATASLALFVGNEHPTKNLADLVALARKEPGKLSYASGNATGAVAGELLKQLAGIDLFHVPYKAAPHALNDVAAGTVTMMFNDITGAMPLMRAGKLRALAVTSRGRARLLPDIPSLYEAGYKGYELYNWVGVFAPGQTSPEIVLWYAQEIAKVTSSADFKEKFERVGLDLVQNDTPAAFAEFVKKEIVNWTRLIRAAGLRPE
jgi:tripartite-type tricarboxylate transporter receptor subunit TctC